MTATDLLPEGGDSTTHRLQLDILLLQQMQGLHIVTVQGVTLEFLVF